MKRAIVILPFMLILAVGGFACYKIKWPGESEELTPKYSLSATRLFNEFQLVEMSANTNYKNQVIEVNGKIRELRSTLDGSIYVVLEAGNPLFAVNCHLAKSEFSQLGKIKVGQEVTLIGLCKGMMLDVLLVNCKFE